MSFCVQVCTRRCYTAIGICRHRTQWPQPTPASAVQFVSTVHGLLRRSPNDRRVASSSPSAPTFDRRRRHRHRSRRRSKFDCTATAVRRRSGHRRQTGALHHGLEPSTMVWNLPYGLEPSNRIWGDVTVQSPSPRFVLAVQYYRVTSLSQPERYQNDIKFCKSQHSGIEGFSA